MMVVSFVKSENLSVCVFLKVSSAECSMEWIVIYEEIWWPVDTSKYNQERRVSDITVSVHGLYLTVEEQDIYFCHCFGAPVQDGSCCCSD
jgi:hypothetical protein